MLVLLAVGLLTLVLPAAPAQAAPAVPGCDDLLLERQPDGSVRATVPSALGQLSLPARAFQAERDGRPLQPEVRRLGTDGLAVALVLVSSTRTRPEEWAQAKAVAIEALRALPEGVPTSLVVGTDRARVAAGATTDRAAVARALAAAELRSGSSAQAAVELAQQQTAPADRAHVLLLADRRAAEQVATPAGSSARISYLVYGPAAAQADVPAGCPEAGAPLVAAADVIGARLQGQYELRLPATPAGSGTTRVRVSHDAVAATAVLPGQQPAAAGPAPTGAPQGDGAPTGGAGVLNGNATRLVLVAGAALALLAATGAVARTASQDRTAPARRGRTLPLLDWGQPRDRVGGSVRTPPTPATRPLADDHEELLPWMATAVAHGLSVQDALRDRARTGPAGRVRRLLRRSAAALDEAPDQPAPLRDDGPYAGRSVVRTVRSDLLGLGDALLVSAAAGADLPPLLRRAALLGQRRSQAFALLASARRRSHAIRWAVFAVVPAVLGVRLFVGEVRRPGLLLVAGVLAVLGAVWIHLATSRPGAPPGRGWRAARNRALRLYRTARTLERASLAANCAVPVPQAIELGRTGWDDPLLERARLEARKRVDDGREAEPVLAGLAADVWQRLESLVRPSRRQALLATTPALVLCLASAAVLVLLA